MSQKKDLTGEDFSKEIDNMTELQDAMTPKNSERGKITFFCRKCEKVTPVTRIVKQYSFRCNICKSTQVAWGTTASIKSHYRIKEEG